MEVLHNVLMESRQQREKRIKRELMLYCLQCGAAIMCIFGVIVCLSIIIGG